MVGRLARWAGYAGALLMGCLAAVFLVLNSLFSDVFSVTERLETFVAVALVYVVLGIAFSFLLASPRVLPWIIAPAAVVCLPFLIAGLLGPAPLVEGSLPLAYLLISLGSTYIGVSVGLVAAGRVGRTPPPR